MTGKAGKAIDGALDEILDLRTRLSESNHAELGWKVAYCHMLAAELQKTTLTAMQRRTVDEMLDVLTPERSEP